MTRDDIIRMARESGICTWVVPPQGAVEQLERFAALVAAAEREECAKVCENMSGPIETYNPKYVHYIGCAKAIRARGQA